MMRIIRYPLMAAAMARAMPVLPEVASIRVSPGRISPRCSARRIMLRAGRSLTDPAGLLPSSLTSRVFDVTPGKRCRRTRGVLPMVDSIVGKSMGMQLWTRRLYFKAGAGICLSGARPGSLVPGIMNRYPPGQSFHPDTALDDDKRNGHAVLIADAQPS